MACVLSPDTSLDDYAYPGTLKNYSAWEMATKIIIGVLVDLFAIVGNGLIIYVVICFKKLRTTTNYYIVNLAVANLLAACFPIWIHIVDDVTDGWVLGAFLCKFSPFIQSKSIILLLMIVFPVFHRLYIYPPSIHPSIAFYPPKSVCRSFGRLVFRRVGQNSHQRFGMPV